MTPISNALFSCNHQITDLPAVQTLQEGVQLINTLLQKALLCRHDICALNQVYDVVCQQESASNEHSKQILKEITDRVNGTYEAVEVHQIINSYYLQNFKGLSICNRSTPFVNSLVDPTKMKEIATTLSACIEQQELEADAKALLGKDLSEDMIAILKDTRELFCKQKKIEERLKSLKQLREKDASLYPSYFDEILQGGFFYLYDHLIQMKQIPTPSEREIQEKKILSFSTFSHIILEFKEAVLTRAEKQIPMGNRTLFLLGDTGSGKSTTLCYLRKDTMVLHDDHYQSTALGTNLIGRDNTRSCTLFPNIDISSDLAIVDFPGFNDTHGKVISFAIEIALRALVKKYCPQILVTASMKDTEGRFNHILRLKDRLKRVLGTLDHCVLGLTKYSQDPDFIWIKNIENRQQDESARPTAEENKLEGIITALLPLIQTLPALQGQIDEAKKALLELQEARVKNSPSSSEEKSRRVKNLKEREENIQEAMGIKNMIPFIDLTNQNQLETILDTLKSDQKISPLPKYHRLDPGDKELLDILFKEKLFQILISSKEYQLSSSSETVLSGKNLSDKIKAFEKNILETSLINTLLSQSLPEIGKFFHLEEMDPAIVREYDRKVIKGCIDDYIHEVISHLSVVQEVIKKFKGQFTPEQTSAVDSEFSSLKEYILTLYGELPESSDQDQVNQAWQGLEKDHQKLIKSKEQELELSKFITVLSLLPLAIPYGIFRLFKSITLGKTEAMSIAKIADQLCELIKASGRAIRDLQGIEKSVIAKDYFDEAFAKYPISLESVDSLKSSLNEQINQVKNIYGKSEWEAKITLLIDQLENEFASQSENVLYSLMSQKVSWEELPPYFNESTYLALMHSFLASQGGYKESLQLLIPGWKAAYPKSLGLNASHNFFYPLKITEKNYEEFKVKGKILLEQYNRTSITRLFLVDAIIKFKEKSSPIHLDETRSFLNLSLQNDLEKIRTAAKDNEWILEYSKEWVRQDKNFLLSAIKLNGKILRWASKEFQNNRDIVMAAVIQNGGALEYANKEFKNDRDFIISAAKVNIEVVRYASEELRNDSAFAMVVIRENVKGLRYINDKFQNNRDFIMAALKENIEVVRYASEELRNDRAFAMVVIRENVKGLRYISENLQNDRELVMAALKENIEVVRYASEELRNDSAFAMVVIRENVKGLRYINDKFQNNRDFIMAALKENIEVVRYASEELRNDRAFAMVVIRDNAKGLHYISENLQNDRELVMAAVEQDVEALKYASKELQNDRGFVLAAIEQDGKVFQHASKELQSDRGFVLVAVKRNGRLLKHVSKELQSDRNVVMTAIKQDVAAFQYAGKELQSDRNFVMAVVKQDVEAFQYANKELQSDREFIMAAVKSVRRILQYASKELQSDRDVVMTAVKRDVAAFQYAGKELQNDRNFVMAVVKQVGMALEYVSKELQNDRKIVMAAVKRNGCALEYANQELQNDRDIVMVAVTQNGWALEYASKKVKNDRDVVMAAVTQNGFALQYTSKELKNDREMVIAAVKLAGSILKCVSEELKNDRNVVMAAVTQNGWALEYASEELKNDREIVIAAVTQAGSGLKYASEEFKNDREIVIAAIIQSGFALEYASKELKNDRDVVMAAVTQAGSALKYASKELQNDRGIVMAAVTQNRRVLQYASKELQNDRNLIALSSNPRLS